MIIVPHQAIQQSARSRLLAEQLRTTIADVRRREPKLTDAEIGAALDELRAGHRGTAPAARRAIALALGVAGLVGGLLVRKSSTGGDVSPATIWLVAALLLLGAGIALIVRQRNNS